MRLLVYAFVLLLPVATTAATVRVVQTNSAGDNIHLIDPATNTVVGVIKGIEVNHGAAAAPDGSRLWVTNEADHTVEVVDLKTLKVTRTIKLSGRPNNLSIGTDGRRVYVAIREAPGAVDVIDTATDTLVKTVPIEGEVHNTFVTPDGRFVVAGSIAGRKAVVLDAKTEQVLWSVDFDRGVRPIAFDRKADGSTNRMFVQLSDFNGFAVVDFTTHKEVARIKLPEVPPAERHLEGLQGSPAHGIAVSPDNKTVWMNSKMNGQVYVYSLADLSLVGGTHVGSHPDWLVFTPDGKSVYVANAGSNSVSVLDGVTRKEVTRVPVGQVPKRNTVAVLP